jgi:hypothetical protein
MTARYRSAGTWTMILVVISCLILILANTAAAKWQEPVPSTPDPTAKSATSTPQDSKNAGDSSSQSISDSGFGVAAPAGATVLGGASRLVGSSGTLRWGDFFVRDVSFTQIHDHSNYSNLGGATRASAASFSDDTSLFQTDLAYNHLTHYGQIALQYQPRLAIVNGSVYPDYSNQNVSFDMLLNPIQRWSYNIHDIFTYFSSQNLYAENYVDADTQTGRAIQNNFLDGSGSLLNEGVSLTASYKWSPRTTIGFSPTYNYLRSTGSLTGTLSSSIYGGAVSVGYALSARQTIGVFFNSQYISIIGPQGNTQVYSTGLSYSRQMGPSFLVSARFGATRNPAYGHNTGSPWTYTGSASVTRGFHYVSLGLVYTRDLAMGYVTNNFADRADGFFAWQLARAIRWRTAVGAQRESGLADPIAAYYSTSQLEFRLTPRVSTFTSYGYRMQEGNSTEVLKGHRNFVSAGIRWYSHPPDDSY